MHNRKNIAIGVDNFKTLREQGSYFVDKSLFIQDVIENDSAVLLFPRPRRFGKTLNLSMLEHFFVNENVEENQKLFTDLAITKTEIWKEHQGKYPVISISLKSCKGKDFETIVYHAKDIILKLYKKHKYLLKSLRGIEKAKFEDVLTGKAEKLDLELSISDLTDYLYHYHHQKVIVLIDEYDTMVHEAFSNDFYNEAVDFLKAMLGKVLKTNPYLKKGVLTGILRVSKESMFSDLNNLKVYTILDEQYEDSFGFTQKEVDRLLKDFTLQHTSPEVKAWYNGYYFGNEEIYNPWSLLNFVADNGKFNAYWLNTSSNDLVHSLILKSGEEVKKAVEDLINQKPVYSIIENNISFRNLEASATTIMSFLVHTGYLKAKLYKQEEADKTYQVEIPNIEVKALYKNVILGWFQDTIGDKDLDSMLKALLTGDIDLFAEIFNEFVLETLSYFSIGKKDEERVYQAFILGMLINLRSTHEVYSEKESGYGRYDIAIIPKDKKCQAIIMELKKIRRSETYETALNAALQQIEERRYETQLRQQGCKNIMKIAVTFDGKRVWTKTGN